MGHPRPQGKSPREPEAMGSHSNFHIFFFFFFENLSSKKTSSEEKINLMSSNDELVLMVPNKKRKQSEILGSCNSQEKAATGKILWLDPEVLSCISTYFRI